MDLSYSTKNLFPSLVHIFDVNGFDQIQNDLIDYAYDFKKRKPEGVIVSNQGGWQSADFPVNNEDDLLQSPKSSALPVVIISMKSMIFTFAG